MIRTSGQALILRWQRFGEGDGRAVLLTRQHGVIHVIAKGAMKSRRRFAGALDLFHHIQFEATRRQEQAPYFLNEASLLNAFLGIRREYDRLWLASCLIELVLKTMEEDGPHAAEMEYLTVGSALQWLSDAPSGQMHWVGVVFLLHWFHHQGWLPDAAVLQEQFHLTSDELSAWKTACSAPLFKLITQEDFRHRLHPPAAPQWFDQLLRWCAQEHSLNLHTPRESLQLTPQ